MHLTTITDFNREDSGLQVYHENSEIDCFHHLTRPFELTMEYCSGVTDQDYFNVCILSPDQAFFDTCAYSQCVSYFQNRPLHRHSFFEVAIVLKGTVIHRIENSEILCPEGTCLILNPNVHHAECFSTEAQVVFLGLPQDMINSALLFPDFAFFKAEKEFLNHPFAAFFQSNQEIPHQKCYLDFHLYSQRLTVLEQMKQILDEMFRLCLFSKPGSSFSFLANLQSFFSLLLDENLFTHNMIEIHSNTEFAIFSKISSLLEKYDGRISTTELEKELNYSRNYMNRIVKKYTEISIFEYSMYFCMKKAALLLETTDLSIAAIASRMGFSNRTHFYQWFYKTYHLTPGEYRNSMTSNPTNIIDRKERRY